MIERPTVKRSAAERSDEKICEEADLQNEPIETRSDTNEVKALRSILDDARQAKSGFPSKLPEGVKPLEAEARVFDGQQEPRLLS